MEQEQQDLLINMRQRRDEKVLPHLKQYAPVWLVDEEALPDEDALIFNTIFYHPHYGWVNRRYRFDSYNNVLYYMGQIMVSEETALDLEDQAPYIPAEIVNTVNSYGG